MAASDVVVIAVPAMPETYHLINAAALAAMKPTAHLVNIARGDIVEEAAPLTPFKTTKSQALGWMCMSSNQKCPKL